MSIYGTRGTAQNWSEEYTQKLVAAGYSRGNANPCLFYSSKTGVSVMLHGDDSLAVGPKAGTKHLEDHL